MRKLTLLAIFLALPVLASAQYSGNGVPNLTCGANIGNAAYHDSVNGANYTCQLFNGIWQWRVTPAGSGFGTVNSGTTGQIGYYAANGTTISGENALWLPLTGGTITGALTIDGTGNYPLAINVAGAAGLEMTDTSAGATLYLEATSNGQAAISSGSLGFGTDAGNYYPLSLSAAGGTTMTGAVTMSGLTNAATGDYVCYNAGLIEYDASTCTLSLAKYKTDIHPLVGSLTEIMRLEPVEYRYKSDLKLGAKLQVGLIADAVAKVDPRIAAYKNDGELESVDYEHMTAILVAAIKEQQGEIVGLRKAVAALNNKRKSIP